MTSGTQLISSGSDGLIKFWTIKTNECVNTFDGHTDKVLHVVAQLTAQVWALALKNDENEFISGGGDAVINIWRDFTQVDEHQQILLSEDRVLKYVLPHWICHLCLQGTRIDELHDKHKHFKKALQLAFALEQPSRILSILEQLTETGYFRNPSVLIYLSAGFEAELKKSIEIFNNLQYLETFFKYKRMEHKHKAQHSCAQDSSAHLEKISANRAAGENSQN